MHHDTTTDLVYDWKRLVFVKVLSDQLTMSTDMMITSLSMSFGQEIPHEVTILILSIFTDLSKPTGPHLI